MIEQIVIAVVIATLIGLLLTALLGPVLKNLPGPLGAVAGDFFVRYGWIIGLIFGIFAFFGGWSFFGLGGYHAKF